MIAPLLALLLSAPAPSPQADACTRRGGKWVDLADQGSGCLLKGQRDGEWTRHGPGGQPIERSNWLKGKRQGASVLYHSNCQVAARGAWKDGKRDGPWTFWAMDGKKTREGSFEADLETGVWVSYHPELTAKHLEGPYVRGRAEGEFTEYLPSGARWRTVKFQGGHRADPEPASCAERGGEWIVDFEGRREGCQVELQEDGAWRFYDGAGKLRSRVEYQEGRREGLVEEFHPTGELLRRAQHRGGIPDGVHEWRAVDGALIGRSVLIDGSGHWRAWHANGRLSEEAQYERGCIAGVYREFNEEGRPLVEDTYANCKRNGAFTSYHQNGTKRLQGEYRDGEPVGLWRAWFSNGDLEWEGRYEKGVRDGPWKFYRWGKKARAFGPMVEGEPTGEWTEFHPSGEQGGVGQKVADRKEGPWRTFWSTGEPWREVTYVNGREVGEAEACARVRGQWAPDAEKRALGCLVCRAKEDDAIDLVGVGVWTFWHPNGAVEKQGPLVEGRPQGEWRYFHDNGAEMMRGGFDGGVEWGRWSGAYRDGQKRFEGDYLAGRSTGVWTSWLPDGGLLSQGRYEQGLKVGAWLYEKRGAFITVDAGQLADRAGGLADRPERDAGVDTGAVVDGGAPDAGRP